jgi:hypothetical protein
MTILSEPLSNEWCAKRGFRAVVGGFAPSDQHCSMPRIPVPRNVDQIVALSQNICRLFSEEHEATLVCLTGTNIWDSELEAVYSLICQRFLQSDLDLLNDPKIGVLCGPTELTLLQGLFMQIAMFQWDAAMVSATAGVCLNLSHDGYIESYGANRNGFERVSEHLGPWVAENRC